VGATLTISEYGDSALRVEASGGDAEERWRLVHALARTMDGSSAEGVLGVVATYDSALVEIEPVLTDHDRVRELVLRAVEGIDVRTPQAPGATFVVPVLYGGPSGGDLADVSAALGLAEEELIGRHLAGRYTVRCLSHAAAPMMDGPDGLAEVARLRSPRVRVAGGSVMLAGRQSMILSQTQPSGWRVIGSTPVRLVVAERADPVVHRPGDVLRFRRVGSAEWDDLVGTTLEQCRVDGPDGVA
jgi:5-oxoprolinase (ATP-hydrolysing) subunit B